MRQFFIIVAISFIGEGLHFLIPLPVPASIYGLLIMLAALCTKLIKVEQVKKTSTYLLDTMSIMFIPAAVGLMNQWKAVKPVIVPILTIVVVITFSTMIVTGRITQRLITFEEKRETPEELMEDRQLEGED